MLQYSYEVDGGRVELKVSSDIDRTEHRLKVVSSKSEYINDIGDTNMGTTSLFVFLDMLMQLTSIGFKAEEMLAEIAEKRANGADEQAITAFLQEKYSAQEAATEKAIEEAEAEETENTITPSIKPSEK